MERIQRRDVLKRAGKTAALLPFLAACGGEASAESFKGLTPKGKIEGDEASGKGKYTLKLDPDVVNTNSLFVDVVSTPRHTIVVTAVHSQTVPFEIRTMLVNTATGKAESLLGYSTRLDLSAPHSYEVNWDGWKFEGTVLLDGVSQSLSGPVVK